MTKYPPRSIYGKRKYTLMPFQLQLVCHGLEYIYNYTFVMKLQFSTFKIY